MSYADVKSLVPDFTPLYFGRRGSQVTGGVLHSAAIYDTLLTNTDWNLYVSVNPAERRRASCRANASEVTHLVNILVDIDPIVSDAELSRSVMMTRNSLFKLLGKGAFDFSSLVFTGRGYQIWIRCEPLALSTEQLRAQASRSVSNILHGLDCGAFGCRIDTSCSDLSRVGRLPGSVNQKTGQRAEVVHQGGGKGGLGGDLILSFAGPEPEVVDVLQEADNKPVGFLLPYLSHRAVTYLTMGVAEPGRHAAAYAAAASLRDIGVSLDRAYVIVRKGAALCNPPLSPADSNRTTLNAYESYRKAL